MDFQAATTRLINDSIVKFDFKGTDIEFIPDSAVDKIATREAITKYFKEDDEISNADAGQIKQLVDKVYDGAKKIFLIAVRCNWPAVKLQRIVDALGYGDEILHWEKDKISFKTHDEDGSLKTQFLVERELLQAKRIIPHSEPGSTNQKIPWSRLPFISVTCDTQGLLKAKYPQLSGRECRNFKVELHPDYWKGPLKMIMREFDPNSGLNTAEYQAALASFTFSDEETEGWSYFLREYPSDT